MKILVTLLEIYSPLMVARLKGSGHEVDVASDGKKAFEYIDNNHYDVLIFGYILLYYNGLEILNHVHKKTDYTPRTIMVSHVYTPQLIENVNKMGLDRFYITPIDLEQFITDNGL